VFGVGINWDQKEAYAAEKVLVDAHSLPESEVTFLARTMWGEARGQGEKGMLAVGLVILNRVGKRRGWHSVEAVVTSPRQFSVWNKRDPNYRKVNRAHNTPEYELAVLLAQNLLRGRYEDFTLGATHYHAKRINPYWAKHMVTTTAIYDHVFYKEKKT
jgi:spore germination cell wall hydrolase CwlJ-like protein